MASYNRAIICGRLGQDPRHGTTDGGKAWAELSVATSEKFGGQEKTEWHRVKVWEKAADFCRDYLTKGALVLVEGRIETRKWQDKEGQDRYTTEIVAQRVQGLDKRQDGQSGGQNANYEQPTREQFAGGSSDGMDDVPF
jgi:single-strand DNA-binding protein